mgnify:CR=1 FL=1
MSRGNVQHIVAFVIGLLVLPVCFFGLNTAFAQTAEQLQAQIEERNERLKEIEKEIASYESALKEVGAEKNTLQKAIDQLNLERQKVLSDIKYTQNKIDRTDLTISKLELNIAETERHINVNKSAIAEILRNLHISDDDTLIELLLRHDNLAEVWNEIESLETVRSSMQSKVYELSSLQENLLNQRNDETDKRNELVSLKSQYSGQQAILDGNRKEKNELLTATKNEEAQYQAQLAAKKTAREQLLKEVQEIESQLQYILDPNSIPKKGSAVFRWPLDNIVITQYFGYTRFALSGAYNGKAHNGIDLSAPVGTKIFAPLTGTVRNTGNTDLVPGCYSWGQWILIDHPNGLSTLFSHLSHIAVSPGQQVATGDVIGYTGRTGYATGPHLHFTVYVSDAVEVKKFNQFKSVTNCGAALSPFSAIEGYLDPIDYLPAA